MLVDDIGSLDHGVARGDGTVGLDLEDKAVVVGMLADTASLNELGATGHRRVERVDVDHTDGIVVTLVSLARDIAAAIADAHAHGEMATLGERSNVLLGVDQLKLGRNKEVRTGDLAGAVNRDGGGRLVGRAESLKTRPLTFRTMSVTSSTMLGMVMNSCCAPSI